MGLSSNLCYGSFRRMNQVFIYVLVGSFILWRVYRRVRRNIGRQKLQLRRIIVRLVLFVVFIFFIILAGLQNPRLLVGYAAGLLGGAALGFVGLKLTQFETTEEGHFYTPDTRIGVAISLLLAGRVIYRMAVLNNTSLAPDHPQAMNSPLTFLIVGLTFGYYIVYYIGLFVHTHDKTPITAPTSSVPPKLGKGGSSPS
jgi:hypothetical protein